jgi:hypothetical protein
MSFALAVNALASLNADIEASVPELTNLTFSTLGFMGQIFLARASSGSVGAPKLVPVCAALTTAASTLGFECPRIRGPQEQT